MKNKYNIGQKVFLHDGYDGFDEVNIKYIKLRKKDKDISDDKDGLIYSEDSYDFYEEEDICPFKDKKELEKAKKVLKDLRKNREEEIEKIEKKYQLDFNNTLQEFKKGVVKSDINKK